MTGLILTSSDGTRWAVSVSDDGTVVFRPQRMTPA